MFLSIFLALGVVYLILGLLTSRKIKTVEDYFLAGRDLGLWSLTITLVATQIGGGMLLGSADAAYTDGYFGVFYTLGMSVGFLALGFGLASKLRQFNVATTAELFEVKYGSSFLRKSASLISALSMVGILASQVVASRALFNVLGINNEFFLLLFWAFVLIYTVMGGLKAVVVTDIFQVIFLVSIVAAVFAYALLGEPLSFFTVTSFVERQEAFSSAGAGVAFLSQLPILLTSALYPLFGQDLAQRFFSARTKKIAALSALFSSAIMLTFSFIPVYFGMKARLLGLSIESGSSVFYSVINVLTNDFTLALVGCALIAAITSTADSLLCAISSNITQDFDYSLSESKKLVLSKVVTCLAGFVSISIAYYSQDILGILSESYGLLISALFVPVFFCFFTSNLKKEAAFVSVFAGAGTFGLLKIVSLPLSAELSAVVSVVLPLVVSFFGYGIGWGLSPVSLKKTSSGKHP